jgi:hypothetical protein
VPMMMCFVMVLLRDEGLKGSLEACATSVTSASPQYPALLENETSNRGQ